MTGALRGAVAAAVTPMRDGGRAIDVAGIDRLTGFLAGAGLDGLLACGTTGEGILLSSHERRAVAERFVAARPGGFLVAVHAGAQTTDETVELAAHALEIGADAVAVIAPPYFPLDDDELLGHLTAAAEACGPLPFYPYSFAARSGYPIPPDVLERLRERAPNLAGLKVSDTPFERVEPFLGSGLDVFVGSEPLVAEGLRRGAAGAVSGLATAWPEVVASLVHDRSDEAHDAVVQLRDRLAPLPFHAALKHVLVRRRVLAAADVRAPLRSLTAEETAEVDRLAAESPGARRTIDEPGSVVPPDG
jgi:dihydrodipicolinate synthase/N-acetylneuraminate lyase